MTKGLFISFEGGEGSGKTTQVNRLADYLTRAKHKVITTREPGGTPEGEKIRELLVQRQGGDWNAMAECLLLNAAREMHVEKIIKPALAKGKIIITDRFSDSTMAYQGYGREFPLDKIAALDALTMNGFKPDVTFVLDIPADKGLARSGRRLAAEKLQVKQTEDRFENLELAFHERLRQGFLDIAGKDTARCRIIDATKTPEEMASEIETIIAKKLES